MPEGPATSSSFGRPPPVGYSGEPPPRRNTFGFVRAHPLLVVALTCLAVLAALVFSTVREQTYEASAQIQVLPIPEGERTLPQLPLPRASSDRTRVIQTAASLVDTPAAARLTADNLGRGWTAERVAGAVDVLPEGESDILAVTAQASDPEVAGRVANEFAKSALDVRTRLIAPAVEALIANLERQLSEQPNASSPLAVDLAERIAGLRALNADDRDPTHALVEDADSRGTPIGPSPSLLFIVSLLAGLAVGLGAALVVDLLGPPRIADAAEAVAVTGLPVLARVPGLSLWQRLRRTTPLTFRPAAASALRTLQYQLELEPATSRRLLFSGGSAGDGVTTTVAELGLTLARAGHAVLVVHLNARRPQRAERLGDAPPTPLSSALAAGDRWEAAVAAVPRAHGLKVLSIGAHGSLGIPDEVAVELPRILRDAGDRFDYVLIDAPPLGMSAEALRVASAVDFVLLLLRPNRTRVPDLEVTVDLLRRAGRAPHGLIVVGGRPSAPTVDAATIGPEAEPAPGTPFVGRSAETQDGTGAAQPRLGAPSTTGDE